MSDLISKQEVIKSIDRFIPTDPMMSDYTQGISVGLAIATRCIEGFSQENHDSSQGLVKDLISRQEAKDTIDMALDHIDHVPPWVYDKLLNALNEVPSAEKAQLSGEDATKDATSDLISRREAIDILDAYQVMIENGEENPYAWARLRMSELPPAQAEQRCVNCGRTANNGGWYKDGRTRCPIEEHYALPKDGYCHLWEKRNVTDDDYPERRKE